MTMLLSVLLVGCALPVIGEREPEPVALSAEVLDLPQSVPALPFEDNPDPELCGLPTPWTQERGGTVRGTYEGELVQPIVYLYEGHLRNRVVGALPSGTPVTILLSQENPQLDYYMVRSVGVEPMQEGWVPAPFLTLDPPS